MPDMTDILTAHQLSMGTNRLNGVSMALCVCTYRVEGVESFAQLHAAHVAAALKTAGYGKVETRPAFVPEVETFTGSGYEAHPGHDHEDCCK